MVCAAVSRCAYLLYRLSVDLVSLISRFINAVVFSGSTAQTLSARSYVEGQTCSKWRRIGVIINAIFFWQENHIEQAWQLEVDRAYYTLERLKSLR